MNIAIVTVYDSIINYGSFLQAYALSCAIRELGHNVYFIRRTEDDKIVERFDNIAVEQNSLKYGSALKKLKSALKSNIVIKREKNANRLRMEAMKRDWESISIIDKSEIKEKKIDLIVCGSDEIWNLHNKDVDLEFYSCGFINGIPKIAYAISSGDTQPEEFYKKPDCIKNFGDFNTILPRDIMTRRMVEIITGQKEDIVCDPTILLGKDSFKLTGAGEELGDYLLVYSYYLTKKEKSFIERYAKENNLKIYSPCIFSSIADEVIYTSALNFPSLINNAKCVFTTTFHGTIFSLMFAKSFCCFPRLPKVMDLLKTVGGEKHAIYQNSDYSEFESIMSASLERKKIDSVLIEMKRFSFDKLTNAIESVAERGIDPLGVHCNDKVRYYYGYSKDEDNVRGKSSSGGLFFELANAVLKNGGVVFGSRYNPEKMRAEHCSTEDVPLEELLRSKYIDSYLGDTFLRVEEFLKQGREVLFCGTPCQAAGLAMLRNNKLKKYSDNLYIVDFLCEGVPSDNVFKQYVEELEKEYKKKVTDVNFRSKYYGWKTHCMKITFEDSSVCVRPSFADSYMHTFIMDLVMNRPSCYNCKFRQDKLSDITIGDFWKVDEIEKGFSENKGVSAIFVNNPKGKKLLDSVSDTLVIKELNRKNTADMLQFLDLSTYENKRNEFYKTFLSKGYAEAIKTYSTYIKNQDFLSRVKLYKRWNRFNKLKK
ncbi:MAG: Coenzyme F420 hydrogenase/dehydrogenase, beta subunit C-terminal domain [Ruminococcus sp.]|nr:Coenzyme F420 hydrogenase/dehydrogenase, beta subunit C-terminal domain [Ruminococcus sp.]